MEKELFIELSDQTNQSLRLMKAPKGITLQSFARNFGNGSSDAAVLSSVQQFEISRFDSSMISNAFSATQIKNTTTVQNLGSFE